MSRRSSRRASARSQLWALIAAAIAVAVAGVLVVGAVNHANRPPPPNDIATAGQSSPLPTASAPSTSDPKVVLIEGDSYVAGSPENGDSPTWGEILDGKDGWIVVRDGIGRTGYINKGIKHAKTIPDRIADKMDGNALDLVILAGGTNDLYWPQSQVAAAVERTIKIIHQKSPTTDIVMFSPFRFHDPNAVDILAVDHTLAAVAKKNKIPYINVRTAFNKDPGLIGFDGVHPTRDGHVFLAKFVKAKLAALGLPRANAFSASPS